MRRTSNGLFGGGKNKSKSSNKSTSDISDLGRTSRGYARRGWSPHAARQPPSPPETITGKAETPCDVLLLSKQRRRGSDLFDVSVYSCDASEMIWGVRNFIWLKDLGAVGSEQQTLKAANHKDLHTCTFSFSRQDLSPILCVNNRGNLFFLSWKNSFLWCLFSALFLVFLGVFLQQAKYFTA